MSDSLVISENTGDIDHGASFKKMMMDGKTPALLNLPSKAQQEAHVRIFGWQCRDCRLKIGWKEYKNEPITNVSCSSCGKPRAECER